MKQQKVPGKNIHLFFILIAALFSLTLTSCFENGQSTALKIGVLLPPVSEGPSQGDSERAAIDEAVEDFELFLKENNINKHIEPVIKNTLHNPHEIVHALNELAEEGINLVVASITSEELNLAQDTIKANDMVVLNTLSTSPDLSFADNIFRLVPDDIYLADVYTTLFKEMNIESIIIFYRNDLWGVTLAEAIENSFLDNSGLVFESIPYGSRDYAIDIHDYTEKLNTAVEDALNIYSSDKIGVVLISFEEAIDILSAANEYPSLASAEWFGSDGFTNNKDLIVNEAAAGFAKRTALKSPIIAEPDTVTYRNLKERIEKTTGYAPYSFAAVAYDAYMLAALTIAETGMITDTELINTALITQAANYRAVTGDIFFNSSGDRADGSYDFWSVDQISGKYQWIKSQTIDGPSFGAKRVPYEAPAGISFKTVTVTDQSGNTLGQYDDEKSSIVLYNGYGDFYYLEIARDRSNYTAYRGTSTYRGFSLSGLATTGDAIATYVKPTSTMSAKVNVVSTTLRWGTDLYFFSDIMTPLNNYVLAGYENWYPSDMSCSIAFYIAKGDFAGMERSPSHTFTSN